MLSQHKMGSCQDLPHVDMMSAITKFAATVPSTECIADMVSMAAREAFNGAPGPAYLEIPRDVLDREIDVTKAVIPQPGRYRASAKSIGDPQAIEALADLLVNSERPAILYGQQVWTARGHEEAIALLRGFDDGPPTVTGAQIGDSGTGLHLALGIVTALYQRNQTGRGQKVLAAMQGGVLDLCRVKLRDQLDQGRRACGCVDRGIGTLLNVLEG